MILFDSTDCFSLLICGSLGSSVNNCFVLWAHNAAVLCFIMYTEEDLLEIFFFFSVWYFFPFGVFCFIPQRIHRAVSWNPNIYNAQLLCSHSFFFLQNLIPHCDITKATLKQAKKNRSRGKCWHGFSFYSPVHWHPDCF